MRIILLILLVLAPGLLWAEETGTKQNIINYVGKHSTLHVDAKTLEDTLGLDYKFALSNITSPPDDAKNVKYLSDLELKSSGYVAAERAKNHLDSTTTSLQFGGKYFKVYENDSEVGISPDRCRQLLDLNPKDIQAAATTSKEYLEIKECFGQKRTRLISWDSHVNYEATQDFKDHDTALGLGVSLDVDSLIPGFAAVLDYPFSWLRDPRAWSVPESPRVYVGYDYVAGLKDTNRAATTGNQDSNMNRATVQVAWHTLVLDKLTIRLLYQAYWELNPPQEVKAANRDFNKLLEVSYSYPTGPKSAFIVKYTRGELPPDFKKASETGIGWSVAFE